MDSEDYTSLVLYYGRARFYHTMQKTALDGLAKYPSQTVFRLFNGIALTLGHRVQEGIRELNPLKNDSELGSAAVCALIYAHERCSIVDKDTISALEQRKTGEQNIFSVASAYYTALFFYLTGQMKYASEYVNKANNIDNEHNQVTVLKAWIQISQGKSANGNILRTLEAILSRGNNIDASLCLVRYYQFRDQFDNAISVLNKLSIRYPELNIPLIEKMNIQLAAFYWDQSFETAQRIVNLEVTNVIALRIKALMLLIREGNIKAAVNALNQLLNVAERAEVGNYDLIIKICQLFSRTCSHNGTVLAVTSSYMDKMVNFHSNSIECTIEQGFQRLLQSNVKEAIVSFQSALKLNGKCYEALVGLTLAEFKQNGVTEQTRQQLQLLEKQFENEQNPPLLFLKAISSDDSGIALKYLIDAAEIKMRKLESLTFGIEYIRILNPDFMLQIVSELLCHSPERINTVYPSLKFPMSSPDVIHITLKQSLTILHIIIRACPAHLQAIHMRAKVELLCGDTSKAISTLQQILNEIDVTYTDAHLLLAQILIQQGQFAKAMQSLEMALSYNFGVRDNPLYHLLLGIILKNQNQLPQAQKTFTNAMQLLGYSYFSGDQHRSKVNANTAMGPSNNSLSVADKVNLFLELISTLKNMGDVFESERLLQYAMEEFNGTTEEGRIIIAHANILLDNWNLPQAINLLKVIQPGQPYYIQAKTHLANIYLKHRKDRVAFAKCFKELVDSSPEPESYLMLGEAYMAIQEPDSAVEVYQKALQISPNNSLLASHLGRSYVKTHQYKRAITYYEEAIKKTDFHGLKLDLAELYLKLKQYQNAAKTLTRDEDIKIDELDTNVLQLRTKELLLLARIYEKSGKIPLSLKILKDAYDCQYRVQKRISVDQSGSLYEQYKILSKICLLMAQQSIQLRDNDQALKYFKECLKYTPNDIDILTSLARLYIHMNSTELCRDVCSQILQIDSNNEAASVMMADLSFRKMEFENAAYHFSQLLITEPCYWTALARLIEVMRRSSTLSEIKSFIQRAEQSAVNPIHNPGLNYCKGLYEWYSGNPNGALRYFNVSRRDYEWGQQGIFNMIEICINPDGDIPTSGDVQDGVDIGEYNDSRAIALRTAERLLKELRPRPGGMDNEVLNRRLLHNFWKLATKQKYQIESALQDFTELASKEEYQNMVGPVLGMASASVLLKQVQRAKNQLKRISRVPWNFEEAEYLERSWLLLADIYIQSNKLDIADSFVHRVLEHNKSSIKAYELAGYIAEKSQSFKEAVKHYQNAWDCGGHLKPHIGYKLAYNYMKIKRYAEAIEVCQKVIKLHPDYTTIRKDIMDKCRSNLRL